MTLKEALESGKPFKYKTHTWFYEVDEAPDYLKKAASNDWEICEDPEVMEKQRELGKKLLKS